MKRIFPGTPQVDRVSEVEHKHLGSRPQAGAWRMPLLPTVTGERGLRWRLLPSFSLLKAHFSCCLPLSSSQVPSEETNARSVCFVYAQIQLDTRLQDVALIAASRLDYDQKRTVFGLGDALCL